jgi:hypothetical protein
MDHGAGWLSSEPPRHTRRSALTGCRARRVRPRRAPPRGRARETMFAARRHSALTGAGSPESAGVMWAPRGVPDRARVYANAGGSSGGWQVPCRAKPAFSRARHERVFACAGVATHQRASGTRSRTKSPKVERTSGPSPRPANSPESRKSMPTACWMPTAASWAGWSACRKCWMSPAVSPSISMTHMVVVASTPSIRGPYLASIASSDASAFHHLATCGSASHNASESKSDRRRRRKLTTGPSRLASALESMFGGMTQASHLRIRRAHRRRAPQRQQRPHTSSRARAFWPLGSWPAIRASGSSVWCCARVGW